MPKEKRGVDYEKIGRYISGNGTTDDAISCSIGLEHFKTLDSDIWEKIRKERSYLHTYIPSAQKEKRNEIKKQYGKSFIFVDKLKKDYRYPFSALMTSMGFCSFGRIHLIDNTKQCCDVFTKANCWASPKDEEILKFRDLILSTPRFKKRDWKINIWDAPFCGNNEKNPPTFCITKNKILKFVDGNYIELTFKTQ
jgi:hypothetical protein